MAIYHPPTPPVFTGGAAQPYGNKPLVQGVSEDYPIARQGGPLAISLTILSIAQPNPWTYSYFGAGQPYAPKRLPIGITEVIANDPPFAYGGPYATKAGLVALAQPDTWTWAFFGATQPYTKLKLSPDSVAVGNQNPPFTYGGPSVLRLELASIAQPNPWTYAFMGGRQPFQPRRLPVSAMDVAVNNPPFGMRLGAARASMSATNYVARQWSSAEYQPHYNIKVHLSLSFSKGYIVG